MMLVGRGSEQRVIGRVLAAARSGSSGALIVRGEAGIGKSMLLAYAAEQADGMRVLRTAGTSSEAELPFSGLHLLLRPVTDGIGRLPAPQAAAMRAALGLGPADAIDRFGAGAALLTLLDDAAAEAPLLVLVDDAQWLDQESIRTLVFAARRLDAEGVAILFAARTREGDCERVLAESGLPELAPGKLDDEAAKALLTKHAGALAEGVRARIIAEAEGNPLALQELATGLAGRQREGSLAPLPVAVTATPAPSRVLQAFADRVGKLPARTRVLVLVAAAEDTGDLNVIVEAAKRLDSQLTDAKAAEQAGLVDVTSERLVFRHPLVRAAVYQRATVAERMATHRALAAVLNGIEQVDRHAWHLAAATVEPDEAVAAELEAAAQRAADRCGTATVVAALERSAQLSPHPDAKATRLARAANAALDAGQPERAVALADRAADIAGHNRLVQARLAVVRANVAFQYQRSTRVAARLLLDSAGPIAEDDPTTATRMLAAASSAAWLGGDAATADRAVAALDQVQLAGQNNASKLAMAARGVQQLLADDFAGGVSLLREVVAQDRGAVEGLPVMSLTDSHFIAKWLGDEQACRELAAAQVAACRARGVVGGLPMALLFLGFAQLKIGRHQDARASAIEGLQLSQDTGQVMDLGLRSAILAPLAAIEGDEHRCEALAKDVYAVSASTGLTVPQAYSICALNLLDLGLGRYEAVLGRLDAVPRGSLGDLAMLVEGFPDLIEAAVRAGQPDQARPLLNRFQAWASHTGQAWAAAVAHRCQALLDPGENAQQHYAAALQFHAGGNRPFEHARTQMAYGQWLRRNRQRTNARAQLRAACETFDGLEALPWAKQAHVELRAAGETTLPTAAQPDLLSCLTSQELQVVRMAAAGATNRDIAAQLFLSPRTVGYHLYKAFPKLGVASRHELGRLNLA